ncbi:hypothetical protein C0995_002476 [Termitomyces sp. Mi166|nr:hypothetical protein C0995_002476 [Termitomyces sp. Mi166\
MPEKAADVFLDAIGKAGDSPDIPISKRLQHLSATFFQVDWLYTELGISPPGLDDLPSLSSNLLGASLSTFQQLSSSVSSMPHNSFSLLVTPTPLFCTWSMTPFLFQEDLLPTPETNYQYIFANFVTKIEEADDDGIAENSPIPTGLQNVEPMQGLLAWAEALQSSLEETKRRCEAHIQTMYDQLEGLWRWLEDNLMVGDDERADFAPFANDEHTEELLMIHEDEIRWLKEERRQKAPLLLEQDPLASIPAWEEEAQRLFVVHGESIL